MSVDLLEPVEPPKGELEHIHYFCGNTEIASDLKEREPQRAALYKATVALVRAYANIADELEPAGYGATDIASIKRQLGVTGRRALARMTRHCRDYGRTHRRTLVTGMLLPLRQNASLREKGAKPRSGRRIGRHKKSCRRRGAVA
jgi:hypothetical protein